MTSPVTISVGDVVYASHFDAYENLTAAWSSWSSTLTNLTVGSGTGITKYRQVGKTINFRFKFIYGSGSAVGTAPTFTLPVAPHSEYLGTDVLGFGTLLGVSGAKVDAILTSGSTLEIQYWSSVSARSAITATAPFTWAAGHIIDLSGTYYTA